MLEIAEKTSVMQTVAGNLQAEMDKELAEAEANKTPELSVARSPCQRVADAR